MSFTSRDGTRGARSPSGPAMRWFNRWLINRIRRRGGGFMGMQILVLGTIGRKTGERRYVPLAWFETGGPGWIVVASANGAAHNPAWYRNIVANPDRVTVELGGSTTDVRAEELHGEERARAWERVVATVSSFRRYEQATDRELPVLLLTPIAAP